MSDEDLADFALVVVLNEAVRDQNKRRNHDFQVQCKLNQVKSMEDQLELDRPSTAESLGNRLHSCATRPPILLVSVCCVPQTSLRLPQVHKYVHFFRSE